MQVYRGVHAIGDLYVRGGFQFFKYMHWAT